MKGKNDQERLPLSTLVVDEAAEKLKKLAQDLGLIVNSGVDKATWLTSKKKGSKK